MAITFNSWPIKNQNYNGEYERIKNREMLWQAAT